MSCIARHVMRYASNFVAMEYRPCTDSILRHRRKAHTWLNQTGGTVRRPPPTLDLSRGWLGRATTRGAATSTPCEPLVHSSLHKSCICSGPTISESEQGVRLARDSVYKAVKHDADILDHTQAPSGVPRAQQSSASGDAPENNGTAPTRSAKRPVPVFLRISASAAHFGAPSAHDRTVRSRVPRSCTDLYGAGRVARATLILFN
jgi:hypothetical protein